VHGSILVPLDGSPLADRALRYARALAAPGADIVLLRVVPRSEPISGLVGVPTVPAADVTEAEVQRARSDLEQTTTTVRAWGLRVNPAVAVGHPAEEILRVAEERAVGMIAMTTHGRGAVGRLVFGSVADRVARAASVPVLIVRPGDDAAEPNGPDIRRLVVPLDGSDLAAEALPVAIALAARLGVPVHLVRAVNRSSTMPFAPGLADGTSPAAAEIYEDLYQQARTDAERALDGAASQLRDAAIPTTREVLTGSAYAAIADAARPGDVIVMTSHGRSGAQRWLLGSIAEKLVRAASVPVVLVPASTRLGEEQPVAWTAIGSGAPALA